MSSEARGLCGLRNLGNTCYMNSALQALSNCPPLTRYLLKQYSWLSNSRSLSSAYVKFLMKAWDDDGGGRCFSPASIVQQFRQRHPGFRVYQQQDAQEFLRCFFDQIHDELKLAVRRYDDSSSADEFETASESSTVSSRSGIIERRMSTNGGPVLPDILSGTGTAIARSRTTSCGSAMSEDEPNTVAHEPSNNDMDEVSIVADVFEGKLLSSVKCLSCNQLSSTRETFQDLSLAIPTPEQIHLLRFEASAEGARHTTLPESWLGVMWDWLLSWFASPDITLNDCLAAFFAADELKGDNMYSCERCRHLRNGVKYSELLFSPEILCIHLKRFRHDSMFGSATSKISTTVQFPLYNLNLSAFNVSTSSSADVFDLCAVICHHGQTHGGHYTCFAKNQFNNCWYEYDDSYVNEVSDEVVANCEAYVLFYKKQGGSIPPSLLGGSDMVDQSSIMTPSGDINGESIHFVSKYWFDKLICGVSNPGPINNNTFLCHHGALDPSHGVDVFQLFECIPTDIAENLYSTFGGGPKVIGTTDVCELCLEQLKRIQERRETEHGWLTEWQSLTDDDDDGCRYLISCNWLHHWHVFISGETELPPSEIDNIFVPRTNVHFTPISQQFWNHLIGAYRGGPELLQAQSSSSPVENLFNNRRVVVSFNWNLNK